MENHSILNWRNLSPTKKGAVIGGLLGASITVAAQALVMVTASWRGENLVAFLFGGLWMGTAMPAWAVYRVLGLVWKAPSAYYLTPVFLIMVITNALIVAVLGGAVGFAVGLIKKNIK